MWGCSWFPTVISGDHCRQSLGQWPALTRLLIIGVGICPHCDATGMFDYSHGIISLMKVAESQLNTLIHHFHDQIPYIWYWHPIWLADVRLLHGSIYSTSGSRRLHSALFWHGKVTVVNWLCFTAHSGRRLPCWSSSSPAAPITLPLSLSWARRHRAPAKWILNEWFVWRCRKHLGWFFIAFLVSSTCGWNESWEYYTGTVCFTLSSCSRHNGWTCGL